MSLVYSMLTAAPGDRGIALSATALLVAIAGGMLILRPRDTLSQIFAMLLAISVLVAGIGALASPGAHAARIIQIGALGLQPKLLLEFCARYGQRDASAISSRGRLLYVWAARAIALLALGAAMVLLTAGWLNAHAGIVGAMYGILMAAQLLAVCAGLTLLVARTRADWRVHVMRPTLLVWIGVAVAYAPSIALHDLPLMLRWPAWLTSADATVLLLALPIASAVSSVRWRTTRLSAVVDRVSVNILLGFALLAAYAIVALAAQRLLALRFSVMTALPTLGLALLTAITYTPLRIRLQRALDTLLYRDYYELGPTVQQFSQELGALRDQEDVVDLLLDGLVETLNLSGVAFVALPEGLDPRMFGLIEPEDLRARRDFSTSEGRTSVVGGLNAVDFAASELSWASPLLIDPWPGCAALVLIGPAHGGQGLALLVVGHKRAGGALRRDDQSLLVTLAHQAGTALENAVLVAGLKTSLAQVDVSTAQLMAARAEQQLLLRELVNADERQRAALARDLHDDALQEVLYLIRHSRLCAELAANLERYPSLVGATSAVVLSPDARAPRQAAIERLRQELPQLAERAVVAEQRLRALCLGLYPALLNSLGLPAALDDLAREHAETTGLRVRVDYPESMVDAASSLDPETALHLYRIAQEGLRNASKHAGASAVCIRLALTPAQEPHVAGHPAELQPLLLLDIEDDGRGLPLPIDYAALLRQGHLGLAGMRERAQRIGRTFLISTKPDGGTRIHVQVPLESVLDPGVAHVTPSTPAADTKNAEAG